MTRILAVDDDSMMRNVIAKALEPLACEVHFASDGIYALDALRCNHDFDLLITDINMTILDGRQLIATIRRDKSLPDLPILITSGAVGISEISDLLELGATRFIPKPINMESFRDDVASCFSCDTVPTEN